MRILYVEDDPVNRKVVQALLGRAGVATDEAVNGEAGLQRVDQGDYDVILMDLRMPVMDGLTAIRHIRARRDDKSRTPIVVITADTSAHIREEALAAGADDLLQKPVDIARLFETIGPLVARRSGGTAEI
ncbi:MAG: response regulator [Alphaproteobacteria bacterium]|nr:response regulator [Alphaproteobacteria bacterium]